MPIFSLNAQKSGLRFGFWWEGCAGVGGWLHNLSALGWRIFLVVSELVLHSHDNLVFDSAADVGWSWQHCCLSAVCLHADTVIVLLLWIRNYKQFIWFMCSIVSSLLVRCSLLLCHLMLTWICKHLVQPWMYTWSVVSSYSEEHSFWFEKQLAKLGS